MLGKRAAIDALASDRLPQSSLNACQGLRVLVKPRFIGRNGLYRIENDLPKGIAVDVVSRCALESRSKRKALFRVWLHKLRYEPEV